MAQYKSLNVNLSDSELKLKSAIKNKTEVVLRLSSNMTGNFNGETNFPHRLSLSNRQVANFVKLLQIIHQFMILSYQKL